MAQGRRGPVKAGRAGRARPRWTGEPVPLQGQPRDAASFDAFARTHLVGLGRLAYLLTGEREAADDLVADALFAAWRRWEAVSAADNPQAYVRGILVKMAGTRVRRLVRERQRLHLLAAGADDLTPAVDVALSVDVRRALQQLPRGQRACVAMRYGLGMSTEEVARTLGISEGAVKSQTSKGAARLRSVLGGVRVLST